jgi:hypothetical protein
LNGVVRNSRAFDWRRPAPGGANVVSTDDPSEALMLELAETPKTT